MAKTHKCIECGSILKHVMTNKYMCDQSPTRCKQSAKIKFFNLEEE
jgi:phage FluMu protein Com